MRGKRAGKAAALMAFLAVLFLGDWLGLYRLDMLLSTSSTLGFHTPPRPNFAVEAGFLRLPDVPGTLDSRARLASAVDSWPNAAVHSIDDPGHACQAHLQEDDAAIYYKTTARARVTAFRMAHHWSVALGRAPVRLPLTAELERDCGRAYDLVILPLAPFVDSVRFGWLERPGAKLFPRAR